MKDASHASLEREQFKPFPDLAFKAASALQNAQS